MTHAEHFTCHIWASQQWWNKNTHDTTLQRVKEVQDHLSHHHHLSHHTKLKCMSFWLQNLCPFFCLSPSTQQVKSLPKQCVYSQCDFHEIFDSDIITSRMPELIYKMWLHNEGCFFQRQNSNHKRQRCNQENFTKGSNIDSEDIYKNHWNQKNQCIICYWSYHLEAKFLVCPPFKIII